MNRIPKVTDPRFPDTLEAAEGAMGRHPLEVFPFFRRWRCGFWRDILYTAIWNSLFALVFSAFWLIFDADVPLARMLKVNFVIAQCIGYSIHVLFVLTDQFIPASRRPGFAMRAAYYAVVPVVGVYGGYWIASVLLGWGDLRAMLLTVRGALVVALIAIIVTSVLLAILIPRERAALAQMRIAREEARVAAAEQAATVARMQLLEAQVEPHFLYNTLAHVVSMIDTEPTIAKRMLDRLIALLRSAAAPSGGAVSLEAQLAHLRAYLDIFALRMGPRLKWTVDVPPELGRLPVPPMLLQPVVENAIRHGLEPKLEGGRVDVGARREGDALMLTVTDTGLGVREHRAGNSTGLGLANLRARLATLYGARATLTIEDHAPSGTRVTIALPLGATAQ